MKWRSESELTVLIESREKEVASLMMDLPDAASEPSEELLTAWVELADLENELQFVRGNPPPSWDSVVPVPVKPFPGLNSEAITLPELKEAMTTTAASNAKA